MKSLGIILSALIALGSSAPTTSTILQRDTSRLVSSAISVRSSGDHQEPGKALYFPCKELP
ncbi:MAG: hypothetical protein SPJ99_06120, partial [Candidatus Coprenecus sp.]|nr:hypothetical protein [Candidatus Coprenecus sp.]